MGNFFLREREMETHACKTVKDLENKKVCLLRHGFKMCMWKHQS